MNEKLTPEYFLKEVLIPRVKTQVLSITTDEAYYLEMLESYRRTAYDTPVISAFYINRIQSLMKSNDTAMLQAELASADVCGVATKFIMDRIRLPTGFEKFKTYGDTDSLPGHQNLAIVPSALAKHMEMEAKEIVENARGWLSYLMIDHKYKGFSIADIIIVDPMILQVINGEQDFSFSNIRFTDPLDRIKYALKNGSGNFLSNGVFIGTFLDYFNFNRNFLEAGDFEYDTLLK